VSENRFLQSFCALVGAAILVCGTHLFLLATSDWDSATLVQPPPPVAATISIDVAPAPVAEQPPLPRTSPQVTVPTEEQPQVATEEQPQIAAEARVGDQTPLASASATLSVEPATKDESAFAAPSLEVTSPAPEVASATPEATLPAPELASPPPSDTAAAGIESAVDDNAERTFSEGNAVAPANDSEIAQTGQQAPQEAAQPQQPEPVSGGVEQTAPIQLAAAEPKSEQPSLRVPLPQRAPRAQREKASPKLAAKEKPAPKPAGKLDWREMERSQATPRGKPMGLAPADKPSISLTQRQPKKSDAEAYSAKIWSALARKKPNAGQPGSTTVTFAIGPGGALRFVRVSQSSGNAGLDQLALATVRNAAPFPPPPVLKDGTATYTIRIDFR
jgi:periplasmic protein TonB